MTTRTSVINRSVLTNFAMFVQIPNTARQKKESIVASCILLLYPVWYFSPVLLPFGLTWFSTESSDLNAFVDQFRVLGSANFFTDMSSQIYETWVDRGLVRVEAIQSFVQYFFGWLVTPIFGAVGALNLYLMIGMASSGLVAYVLSRRLGASTLIAIFAGLTVQSLPWIRQNILFGTACVFISVPLGLVVLLARLTMRSLTVKNLIGIAMFVGFLGLFYSYWFFFGLFILAIWIASSVSELRIVLKSINARQRFQGSIIFVSLFATGVAVFRILLMRTQAIETGEPYGVYSVDQVLTNVNTLRGLVTPDAFHLLRPTKPWTEAGDDQNYLGVFVAFFGLLRLIRLVRSRSLVTERRIALVAVACFLLAMGRINIAGFEIPSLRELMRFVMPGIRQFSRAGLIAQALLVVLAWKEIGELAKSIRRPKLRIMGVLAIGVALLLDLNLTSRRFVYEPPIRYREVNSFLQDSKNSLLFISQNSEPDYGFFETSLVSQQGRLTLYANLDPGSSDVLAGFLSTNVTHVLANVDDGGRSHLNAFIQDAVRFKLDLPPNKFRPLGDEVRVQEREDFGGPIIRDHLVRLVQVESTDTVTPRFPSAKTSCFECRRLAQFVADPPLEVVNPAANRSFVDTDWSISNRLKLRAEPLPDHRSTWSQESHFMRLQLVSPEVAGTTFVKIQVKDRSGLREFQVSPTPTWVTVEFDQHDSAHIESSSECLIVSSDNGKWGALEGRPVCFGIKDFVVFSQSNPGSNKDGLTHD
jgi:hypothetical protein